MVKAGARPDPVVSIKACYCCSDCDFVTNGRGTTSCPEHRWSGGSGGGLAGLAPLPLFFPRFRVRTEFPPSFVTGSPDKVSLPTLTPVLFSLDGVCSDQPSIHPVPKLNSDELSIQGAFQAV